MAFKFHLALAHQELKAKLEADNKVVSDYFEPEDLEVTRNHLDLAHYPEEDVEELEQEKEQELPPEEAGRQEQQVKVIEVVVLLK